MVATFTVQCAVAVQAEVAAALQRNATFKAAFELQFRAELAASAGVASDRVTITGYAAATAVDAADSMTIAAAPPQRARLLLQAEAEKAGGTTVFSTVEVRTYNDTTPRRPI